MTARDATNLLIAVNGASLAKDAPIAIARYREMKAHRWWEDSQDVPAIIRELLVPRTNFGDAFERLIELFTTAQYPDLPLYQHLGFLTLDGISVRFHRPRVFASIDVRLSDPRKDLKPVASNQFVAEKGIDGLLQGGRQETTTINEITLMAVGRVLAT
jgi:hypothetical protein